MIPVTHSIEEIREKYKYEIDFFEFWKNPDVIHDRHLGRFMIHFDEYNFNKRLNIIDDHLKREKDKINKDLLESNVKEIKEIRDEIEIIPRKMFDEHLDTSVILEKLENNYHKNEDVPGAMNLYKKLFKEILDEEVERYIHQEKVVLLINDKIIDIFHKLNLNN